MTVALVPTDAHEELAHGIRLPEGGLGLDEVQERMRGAARLWFAVADGEAVGLACYFDDSDMPEIGYGISPACRGRGLAKAIVPVLQDLAVAGGRKGLTARSAEANPASGAVLSSTGFEISETKDEPEFGRIYFWTWKA